MATEDRLTQLLAQSPITITGIDFLRVVEPHDQRRLHVYFHVDPEALTTPFSATPIDPTSISIVSEEGGSSPASATITSVEEVLGDAGRYVLELQVAEPGDFSRYRLTIDDSRIDYAYSSVVFSFKQGCPTRFDCKARIADCTEEDPVDVPIDYLARDFQSLRGALVDFTAQRYPEWGEKIEADAAMMVVELAAALGDELSYVQDRYARETALATATQRRSVRHHARLMDYPMHDGLSAKTWLQLTLPSGVSGTIDAGSKAWAPASDAGGNISFEIGDGLADGGIGGASPRAFAVDGVWNAVPLHMPDGAALCLEPGATEAFVVGQDFGAWVGRTLVLRSDSADGSLPPRRHLIHPVLVEAAIDYLGGPAPYWITRICWDESEALPFAMPIADSVIAGNVLPAVAGEVVEELFTIRPSAGETAAIERQGPHDAIADARSVTFLYSLSRTEAEGLGFVGDLRSATPEVEVVDFDTNEVWEVRPNLLDSLPESRHVTLEDGTWRRVMAFQREGVEIVHHDYASGEGYTLRFGDGEMGRVPPDGTRFRARYRVGSGRRANLPADTVIWLADPAEGVGGTALQGTFGAVVAVANPFDITTGCDREDIDAVRRLAPEAYQADLLRAVRPEEYAEQAERLPWVERAGATRRWTGSWYTTFTAADPLGTHQLSAAQRLELEKHLEGVRQAGHEVLVLDPLFADIDLRIEICVAPSAYPAQVEAAVQEFLMGKTGLRPTQGFFHPDHFTFGTPLRRAHLEAAIQSVAGVAGVLRVCVRMGRSGAWGDLPDTLSVPADRILRLRNDQRVPERGTLRIIARSEIGGAGLRESNDGPCALPEVSTPIIAWQDPAIQPLISYSTMGTCARAGEASWEKSPGVVQWWSDGQMRYLPGHGVALEPSETNLLLQSEALSNSGVWIGTNASVDANKVRSPDQRAWDAEIVDADIITFTGSGVLSQSASMAANTKHSFSIWLRSTGPDAIVRLRLKQHAASEATSEVNVSSEWRRHSLEIAGTPIVDTPLVAIEEVSGTSIAAWGAQLTVAPGSSYIRTEAAQATRNAAHLLLGFSAFVAGKWNYHDSAWKVTVQPRVGSADIVSMPIFHFGTTNGRSMLRLTPTAVQIVDSAGAAQDVTASFSANATLTIVIDPVSGAVTLSGFDTGSGLTTISPWTWQYSGDVWVGSDMARTEFFSGIIGEPYAP